MSAACRLVTGRENPAMKAYLIDPVRLEVTQVQIGDDYREIYKFIDADIFECVQINRQGDAIYIDEEGMLKNLSQQIFFMYKGYSHPLAGKGLILGTNKATGESREPTISLNEVIKAVSFLTPYQVQA